MKKNIFYAQSGGVTPVINATAAGADGYILVSNSGTPEWTSTVDGGTF